MATGPTRGVEYFEQYSQSFGDEADVRPEFAERYAVMTRAIDEALQSQPRDAVVMDLGCGRGHLTAQLARRSTNAVAVDGSRAMLDGTASRLADQGLEGVAFRQELLPLPDAFVEEFAGQAALIVLSSVIEYVERDDELLDQCRRMLRPGGALLVSFPNATSLYWKVQRRLKGSRLFADRGSRHQVHQYSNRDIRRKAAGAGFSVEHLEHFAFPLQRLLPVKVSARPALLATLTLARLTPT